MGQWSAGQIIAVSNANGAKPRAWKVEGALGKLPFMHKDKENRLQWQLKDADFKSRPCSFVYILCVFQPSKSSDFKNRSRIYAKQPESIYIQMTFMRNINCLFMDKSFFKLSDVNINLTADSQIFEEPD